MPDLPLRDIHLPEPTGFWPLATGWWLLMLLVLLVATACLLWLRFRPTPVVQRGLRELASIEAMIETSPEAGLRRLSILLRRVCLSRHPREHVAGLTGEAWLALLDQSFKTPRFATGPGRYLVEAPYRPNAHIRAEDIRPLLALCRLWLKSRHHPRKMPR